MQTEHHQPREPTSTTAVTVESILKTGLRLTPERVEGVFALLAVGDALGLPVETWSASKIAERFGTIRTIHSLEGNPYLKDAPTGIYSDDTQLTLAVSKAIVSPDKVDIQILAQAHVEAYWETTAGWGHTTRVAVERLMQGESPEVSGKSEHPKHGSGNGVIMKIAPVALWAVSKPGRNAEEIVETVHQITKMTHATPAAAATAVGHVFGMIYCLGVGADVWNSRDFFSAVEEGVRTSLARFPESEFGTELLARTMELPALAAGSSEGIIERCGGGSAKCIDSAPFSWAFFVKAGGSVGGVFDVIEAGGDTDSNGSIVGSLVGALHGRGAVPEHLLTQVRGHEQVISGARALAERLSFNK